MRTTVGSDTLVEQLAELTRVQSDFVEIANRLDLHKCDQPGVCGEWSPKDVVAHLVGWDNALLEFITDIDNFTPPVDIDQFNQQSVQIRKHLNWPDIMREMEIIFRKLRQAVVTVTPEMQVYDQVASWLTGRTEDYELHRGQFIAWLT